jgi:hypothetical protein
MRKDWQLKFLFKIDVKTDLGAEMFSIFMHSHYEYTAEIPLSAAFSERRQQEKNDESFIE